MRRLLLSAVAASLAFGAVAASAQPYYGRYDRNDYYRERDRGYRSYGGRWREGQVYPYYRYSNRMIGDWRRYHLPPPRPGYAYYYDDNGDVVMAALASGIIGLVIGGALANGNNYNYPPPAYGYPYGYSAPYSYDYGYPY
jgi:hypothetical protein